jgi:hypothetical protein
VQLDNAQFAERVARAAAVLDDAGATAVIGTSG